MVCSALTSISGFTAAMRDCKNKHILAIDFVEDGIRKMPEKASLCPMLIHLPLRGILGKTFDAIKGLEPERSGCFWVAFLIPEEGCFYLCLSIGQDENVKQAHKASSLVLASAHGIARMLPSRRPALRRRISARQASETLGSSLPSMLSSRATTKAERWSVGRRRASSSRWSMRAFMESSLAARMPPVMHAGARTPNPSVISPAVVQRIRASHAFTASDA